MSIEHLAIWTRDAERPRRFYVVLDPDGNRLEITV